jgi:hypothetical protein
MALYSWCDHSPVEIYRSYLDSSVIRSDRLGTVDILRNVDVTAGTIVARVLDTVSVEVGYT